MGEDAIADRKLGFGNPLTVLGVQIEIADEGVKFWPAPEKVQKWLECIEAALEQGFLVSVDASKLSGRLQWASQYAFRRLGRALLRPIIDHIRACSSEVGPDLRLVLLWWADVLRLNIR